MKSHKKVSIVHLLNVLLLILLCLIQYNSVFSIKIHTASPMLPLALLIAISMFCSELRGALTGLVVGIFVDAVATTPQGFNAITFAFVGLASVLITKHLFNNNILSAIALCALGALFYFVARWIFSTIFSLSFIENLNYFMWVILPSTVYTSILIIPFYYLEKLLYKNYYK